jgi:hypothetical protein
MKISINTIFRKKRKPLTGAQAQLLARLIENREIASQKIVPSKMRTRFEVEVYSDRHLEDLVRNLFNPRIIPDDEKLRILYLNSFIRLSLSIQGFGLNLITRYRIDPELFAQAMLKDIAV